MNNRQQLVFAIARSAGLPVVVQECQNSIYPHAGGMQRHKEEKLPYWDGRVLWVHPDGHLEDVIHDICHFLEAPRGELYKENFGLSEDPEDKETLRRDRRADMIQKGLEAAIAGTLTDYTMVMKGMGRHG